jgi:hypothetical protein
MSSEKKAQEALLPVSEGSDSESTESTIKVTPVPLGAYRVQIDTKVPLPRLDTVLLDLCRKQKENIKLKILSRASLKELFKKKRIRIKGQIATPSSSIAIGTTYVDILGFALPEKKPSSDS